MLEIWQIALIVAAVWLSIGFITGLIIVIAEIVDEIKYGCYGDPLDRNYLWQNIKTYMVAMIYLTVLGVALLIFCIYCFIKDWLDERKEDHHADDYH